MNIYIDNLVLTTNKIKIIKQIKKHLFEKFNIKILRKV